MSAAVPHFILYSFESSKKEFNAFLDVYYPIKCMIPPDTQITNLKLKADRICRFCQRSVPEVTFKKKAHIIPESLGNKYLVSDFECDDCNEKVSKLETDFSAWLGAIKPLSGTKGKKGVPKFRPANDTIAAEKVAFLDTSATKISKGKTSPSAFSLDKKTGGIVYQFKKEGYVPIRAYKTLLKMALSMTGQEERDAYLRAFDFLIGPDENAPMQQFAKVICLELPMNHTIVKPVGQLFQKIDPLAKYPLHYFTLHYEHFIYGFPLPFNQVDIDKGCYGGNNIDVLYAPPITFWQPEKGSIFYSHTEDFSSAVKRVAEQQTISFNLSPEDLKKMKAIDPKTGEFKDGSISGEDIATLLILSKPVEIKKGQQFDLP